MDFFAAYYKEKFGGMKYSAVKKVQDHPKQVLDLLEDGPSRVKVQLFIENQRRLAKRQKK